MNITLSSDADVIAKTREFARKQGMSLNELLRRYMESVTQVQNAEAAMTEFARNAREYSGNSAPDFRFNREEAHDR